MVLHRWKLITIPAGAVLVMMTVGAATAGDEKLDDGRLVVAQNDDELTERERRRLRREQREEEGEREGGEREEAREEQRDNREQERRQRQQAKEEERERKQAERERKQQERERKRAERQEERERKQAERERQRAERQEQRERAQQERRERQQAREEERERKQAERERRQRQQAQEREEKQRELAESEAERLRKQRQREIRERVREENEDRRQQAQERRERQLEQLQEGRQERVQEQLEREQRERRERLDRPIERSEERRQRRIEGSEEVEITEEERRERRRKRREFTEENLGDIKRGRRERREDGGRVVIEEPGNRRIIREGRRVIIENDDGERLRGASRDVEVERGPRGRTRTIITRPNGVQIITVRNRDGEIVRRIKRLRNGREVVLFNNEIRRERRARREERDGFNFLIDLPNLRVAVPSREYYVYADGADEDEIEETLSAPPLEEFEDDYTLDEIRYSPDIRARLRKLNVNTVQFDFGSWEIREDQFDKLEVVARVINRIVDRDAGEIFLLGGHTDAVGSDEDNLSLSDRRAETVARILTDEFGVPPENLVTQGYGESDLLIDTQSAEGANRRVEFMRITPALAQYDE